MAQTPEGAIKVAAKKAGLSVEVYTAHIAAGLKRCTLCKTWHPRTLFDQDRSRYDGLTAGCQLCRRVKDRRRRTPRETPQARQKAHDAVRWAIRRGHLERAAIQTCRCGQPAKEYHHPRGYLRHELDVEALCLSCHRSAHWEPAHAN